MNDHKPLNNLVAISTQFIILECNFFPKNQFYCCATFCSKTFQQTYKEGQRILERQRFQFPAQWLYIDNIEGEWGAFSDIMKRKDSSIQTRVASLQMKIASEDNLIENKTGTLLQEWEKEKPVTVSCLFITCICYIFFNT